MQIYNIYSIFSYYFSNKKYYYSVFLGKEIVWNFINKNGKVTVFSVNPLC